MLFRAAHLAFVLAGLMLGWNATRNRAAADEKVEFRSYGVAFLKQYCLKCHEGDKPEAELALDAFQDEASVIRGRKTWATILSRVQTGDMPPDGNLRPAEEEVKKFVAAAQEVFAHADRNAKPDPGRVTMRRLNRIEYRNTIRDLIGVDFDPTDDFPSDDIGHGFDNIGDVLSVSPVLMERYLAAAESIMQQAILPALPKPVRRDLNTRYSEPASGNVPMKGQYRFLSTLPSENPVETGPIFTRYQLEPENDYVFRTRLYAYREKSLETAAEKKKNEHSAADDLLADIAQETGGTAKLESTSAERPIYAFILACGKNIANPATDKEAEQVAGLAAKHLRPFAILQKVEVTAREAKSAQKIEIKLSRIEGVERIAIGLMKEPIGTPAATLFVEYLSMEGPLDTRPLAQRKLLALDESRPKEEQTHEVLRRFTRRAYRRPPITDEIERLAKLVEQTMADGANWEAGMQFAMQAVLCSPKFLFRVETDESPDSLDIRPLNEFQLASRLSYFLWSTMPDEELLSLAEQGKLLANLQGQVERMLQHEKSQAMLENFSLQWLQLRRLENFEPDAELFPEFDNALRKAMLQETSLFFAAVARENRSILELLDADFTYVNERLAKHYGLSDIAGTRIDQKKRNVGGKAIKGSEFVRVSLAGSDRGGLLTQASVLTVTSNPTRTSPVKRGRWVLEQILGEPPPPPPPDVPELPESEQEALAGSLRERFEQHRSNPACASCHSRMDPLGFAFEHFDAIGAFREKDGQFEIDSSGELPGGEKFAGAADLKVILRSKKVEFARCLTEKLLTYAIGRGVEYYDRPTVERILQGLANQDYRFSALITEIVRSDAFLKRRGLETVGQ